MFRILSTYRNVAKRQKKGSVDIWIGSSRCSGSESESIYPTEIEHSSELLFDEKMAKEQHIKRAGDDGPPSKTRNSLTLSTVCSAAAIEWSH